jgi:hypothetical protein
MPRDLYFFNPWRLEQERAFDADAVRRQPADRETRVHAALADAHDGALKYLDALAVTFDDPGMHLDAVARLEDWDIGIRVPFRNCGY